MCKKCCKCHGIDYNMLEGNECPYCTSGNNVGCHYLVFHIISSILFFVVGGKNIVYK